MSLLQYPPQGEKECCFLSIDPGTNYLGVSRYVLKWPTTQIEAVYATTYRVDHLEHDYVDETSYTERFGKIAKLQKVFDDLLKQFDPIVVISEAPFYNRLRPSAFAPLVELIQTLRWTNFLHNPYVGFHTVEPIVVKKSLGANYLADKLQMRQALADHQVLNPLMKNCVDQLDEHAIDAIAVGWAYYSWYYQS
jgi:Holliday junction resolvasome RuvABC endonuclease subunit